MAKLSFHEEIADRLMLPAGATGLIKVTIMGRSRALVEDHKGILEYTRECIEINGGNTRLRIRGEALELVAMDREALLVTGRILSVELD